MNMLKKIFAVAAVSLAAPFFFGGATACGESCVAKCERQTKECNPDATTVTGCADVCKDQDAAKAGKCGSQFSALLSCADGLSKDDRCADGGLAKCSTQVDAIITCCTTNPDAAGCTTG